MINLTVLLRGVKDYSTRCKTSFTLFSMYGIRNISPIVGIIEVNGQGHMLETIKGTAQNNTLNVTSGIIVEYSNTKLLFEYLLNYIRT